ncbi:34437_t:CDS:2, partial [Gigaspora margarita]
YTLIQPDYAGAILSIQPDYAGAIRPSTSSKVIVQTGFSPGLSLHTWKDINNSSLVAAENKMLDKDVEMVDKDVFEKSDEMVDNEGWINLSITNN